VLTVTAHNAAGDMGSATITVTYTPGFNTRVFKDVNGDGKADLVWRHSITGDVAVWLLNGPIMIGGGVVGSAVDLNWQLVGGGGGAAQWCDRDRERRRSGHLGAEVAAGRRRRCQWGWQGGPGVAP